MRSNLCHAVCAACFMAAVATSPALAQDPAAAGDPPLGQAAGATALPRAEQAPQAEAAVDARSWLERHGVTFVSLYTVEAFGRIDSPRLPSASRYLGSCSPSITLDLRRMGAGRGEVFASGHLLRGQAPEGVPVQRVSNLDAPSFEKVAEVWYADTYWSGRLRLKGGWQYADAEFGVLETARAFLNASYGAIPTTPMPSYPDSALGLTSWVAPIPSVSVGVGVFRGALAVAPEGRAEGAGRMGPFAIVEARAEPFRSAEGPKATFRVGMWRQSSGALNALPGPASDAASRHGFYATAEHRFGGGPVGAQAGDWGVFAQWGMAPPGASEVSRYVGGGIVRQGPIPSRPDDAAGAGITRAALFEGGRETVLEVFYQLQLHGGAFVQPDLQWIDSSRHPRSRAIAAGVRFGLEF